MTISPPKWPRDVVDLHRELSAETWRVVFKDNGFEGDSAKVNIRKSQAGRSGRGRIYDGVR